MPRFVGPGSGPLWVHDLFWLLIVVALVIGVILIVRTILDKPRVPGSSWPAAHGWPHQNPALQELDLRYARGEMDRTEYLQRRADLLGQPPPDSSGTKPAA